jgi:membrane-associated phospholipid phosphatase
MKDIKIGNFLANLFSYLFHPLLMITYSVVIFFYSGHFYSIINASVKNTFYFLFFILTFLAPALLIPLINYLALSSKKEISSKKIKSLTMLVTGIMYSVTLYYMNKILIPPILTNIIISAIVLIAICLIISCFWNISIYACGMGALLGFSGFLAIKSILFIPIILLVILSCGIVATSRLYLGKHNPLQVYSGFICGVIVVLCFYIVFKF